METEVVNTGECGGMAYKEPTKWYHWHRFPLLPICWLRKKDEFNCTDFGASWLNMRLWTTMSPDIGIGVMFEDTSWYFKIHLPYLIFVFYFMWFPSKWRQKLWRIP